MTCTSGGGGRTSEFPVGLRVLVVDDDVICLRVLEQMLRKCLYIVTSCSQATVAINLLRERKGCFDIVLSDVHMPDMDGFRLLELVGLEMDLPVIMMSADGRTNLVMRGIKHGACDYLIKPIRDEELKNIWQHVVRKKWNGIKEHEHSGAVNDHDRKKRVVDDADCASSANEGSDDMLKTQKKRREPNDQEDDSDMENDESMTGKKPRVVWSVELHQQFVCAVNQLGIDKAVPKRILELMNVPRLTRENVASHLQKFRLYLKRLSGTYCVPVNQMEHASLGRFDMQLPSQTIAVLRNELLSRTRGSLVLPATMDDQLTLLHPSLRRSKSSPLEPAYGQPLIKCSSNISRPISQPFALNKDVRSEFVAWSGMVPEGNLGSVVEHDNMLISFTQQQQRQHRLQRPQKQSGIVEPSRAINVQPSCLVVPSQSTSSFQGGNPSLDYDNRVNYSCSGGQTVLSKSMTQDNACQQVLSLPSTFNAVPQVSNIQRVQGSQGLSRTPVYVGKGTKILPSRFAVEDEEHELPANMTSQLSNHTNNSGNKVKQETNVDLMEVVSSGVPVHSNFPQTI